MRKSHFITSAVAACALGVPFILNASVPIGTAIATTTSVTTTPQMLLSKEVALTFDDGPYGTSTEAVLAILKREQVPATFFLIGKNVEKYPALAKEIAADGHVIGNHTYDHTKHLATMSLRDVRTELSMADAAIASTTGLHTKLFRPPYGRITKRLRRELVREGYAVFLWNVDPRDWDAASTTSQDIIDRIAAQEKDKMIILLHDGRDTKVGYPRDNMINALPIVIEMLKREGYTFTTVEKM